MKNICNIKICVLEPSRRSIMAQKPFWGNPEK